MTKQGLPSFQQPSVRSTKKSVIIENKKDRVKSRLKNDPLYSLEVATEKGASSWLNAIPLKRYLDATESEFHDGFAVR